MNIPHLMGTLYSDRLKGKEIFSFKYDIDWLQNNASQLLYPNLQLFSGLHYPNEKQDTFGIFLDSSPDRWSRILMRKRESALAKKDEIVEQKLYETEYHLGVFDEHRMGALRLKLNKNGPFLNNNKDFTSPPWTSISELEQISIRLEEDNVIDELEYLKWLNMIIAPGSSLG